MFKSYFKASGALILSGMILSGCTVMDPYEKNVGILDATVTPVTSVGFQLRKMPPASKKIDVAVYAFEDQTGQQKPAEGYSDFSKAVTQGAEALIIDVLRDVGNGAWFNVVERKGLKNLLTERSLIDKTNADYRNIRRSVLPPLRFAGIILEGGIIDYDSNIRTGGYGARILGVGGTLQYRRDRVSVGLRAVSVATGEVLASVQTEKTVYSVLEQDSAFLYVSSDAIFEAERGYTRNEPVGLAVKQAIELAVYGLVIEGAESGLWSFADRNSAARLIGKYRGLTAYNGVGANAVVNAPKKEGAVASTSGPAAG